MTKYVLHGGFSKGGCNNTREFYHEIGKELSDGERVLSVYFHVDEASGDEKHQEVLDGFKGNKLEIVVASECDFVEQLKKSSALLMRGGDTIKLSEKLKKYRGLAEIIKEKKVVAGVSAGAYVLSEYFYTNHADYVDKGLGVLPIRTRCHYVEEDDKKIAKKFSEFPESDKYELVLLRDCEYKVIRTN